MESSFPQPHRHAHRYNLRKRKSWQQSSFREHERKNRFKRRYVVSSNPNSSSSSNLGAGSGTSTALQPRRHSQSMVNLLSSSSMVASASTPKPQTIASRAAQMILSSGGHNNRDTKRRRRTRTASAGSASVACAASLSDCLEGLEPATSTQIPTSAWGHKQSGKNQAEKEKATEQQPDMEDVHNEMANCILREGAKQLTVLTSEQVSPSENASVEKDQMLRDCMLLNSLQNATAGDKSNGKGKRPRKGEKEGGHASDEGDKFVRFKCISSVRRLVLHHPEMLPFLSALHKNENEENNHQHLHAEMVSIFRMLCHSARDLRSSTSRNSLLCLKEMFEVMQSIQSASGSYACVKKAALALSQIPVNNSIINTSALSELTDKENGNQNLDESTQSRGSGSKAKQSFKKQSLTQLLSFTLLEMCGCRSEAFLREAANQTMKAFVEALASESLLLSLLQSSLVSHKQTLVGDRCAVYACRCLTRMLKLGFIGGANGQFEDLPFIVSGLVPLTAGKHRATVGSKASKKALSVVLKALKQAQTTVNANASASASASAASSEENQHHDTLLRLLKLPNSHVTMTAAEADSLLRSVVAIAAGKGKGKMNKKKGEKKRQSVKDFIMQQRKKL